MSQLYLSTRKIRFSQCDPAGIVYFVHFFDMMSSVVEDWFDEIVGFSFQEMHLKQRYGFPIVNTGCEFFRPCVLGDQLVFELAIARLGRSSIEFAVRGRVRDEEKFRARHKVAMMSLDTQRAVAVPEDLRTKMLPYVAAG